VSPPRGGRVFSRVRAHVLAIQETVYRALGDETEPSTAPGAMIPTLWRISTSRDTVPSAVSAWNIRDLAPLCRPSLFKTAILTPGMEQTDSCHNLTSSDTGIRVGGGARWLSQHRGEGREAMKKCP
jgi:hypothetical protein